MHRYFGLRKIFLLIALAGASLMFVHAESVLSPLPPVALPEAMSSAQMKAWKAELAAKNEAQAASSSTPGTLNSGVPTPLAPQKLGAALQSNQLPPVAGFYTGKPYIAETGGYAFKYREYNPEMSRWTTVDPSGFPDGANNRVYAAVPTSQLDNNGLDIKYTGLNPDTIVAVAIWNGAESFASSIGANLVVTAMQHAENGTSWNNDTSLSSAIQNSSLYSDEGGIHSQIQAQLSSDLNGQTSDPNDVVNSITTAFDPVDDPQLFWAMHGITFDPFVVNVGYGNDGQWSADGNVKYSKNWDFSHHLNDLFSPMGYYSGYSGFLVNADGIYLEGAGLISPFNVTGSFSDVWSE